MKHSTLPVFAFFGALAIAGIQGLSEPIAEAQEPEPQGSGDCAACIMRNCDFECSGFTKERCAACMLRQCKFDC